MNLTINFHKILIFKAMLFFLIVIWGGYNQTVTQNINNNFFFLDIGGLGFLIFSICYLWSCYSLYKLKKNSRVFFLSLVGGNPEDSPFHHGKIMTIARQTKIIDKKYCRRLIFDDPLMPTPQAKY